MRIGETLKKAAGLLIEFEDEDALPRPSMTGMPMTTPSATPRQKTEAEPATRSAPASAAALTPQAKTVEQIVKESPGPNLDEIKPPANTQTPVIGPDGRVNYPAIYHLAALPQSPFTAEQVLELLASLPAELPLETKRATMKVTLGAVTKSLGVAPDAIVADASRKLAALAAYANSYTVQAQEFVKKTEEEIDALQKQIDAKRLSIEDTKLKQDQMIEACTMESDRLDDILEFFSLDVPPSKYAEGANPQS